MRTNQQPARLARVMRAAARIFIIAILGAGMVSAENEPAPATDAQAIPVTLLVGRSKVIDIPSPIGRVSLTSADVADALVTSPSQLLVNGKAAGTISMFVWERSGQV